MILLKIIFLQLFWFVIVLKGKEINPALQLSTALILVYINYVFTRVAIKTDRYLFLILFFILFGFLNDSSLIWFNIIAASSYQIGNLSLWIVFIIYYEKIFVKLKKLSLPLMALLGGVSGALTYWSTVKLGAIVINPGMELNFTLSQVAFWAVFLPLSLKVYYENNLWDSFLDKTIFFSFDRSGFLRHKNKFTEDLLVKNLKGKNALVTGATNGIGAAVGIALSHLGSKVYITGRNQQKGLAFELKNLNSKFVSLDMGNWQDVYHFAQNTEFLDYVVFNAGGMPETLEVNENGVEAQCASQLLGHFYLLSWLKDFSKINDSTRIVWVSSGGMYLKKLDLVSLFKNSNYDKVETYANVKRAQITLVEELLKKDEWKNYNIYSMHPGWVGTNGLKDALPKFYKLMKERLRTPDEGADTILWCLLAERAPQSGAFYFDRKKVSPYISKHFSPTDLQRAELFRIIESFRPN